MTPTEPAETLALRHAYVAVAGAGVAMAGGAAWLGRDAAMPSILLGTLLAIGNLWAIARVVGALLGGRTTAPWSVIALFKFAALFGVVYALVTSGTVAVLPLALGYGALPVGLMVMQLRSGAPVPERG